MKSSSRKMVDRFPLYTGSEWDSKISTPDHPNFWKYGISNLMFLDYVRDKKLLLDLGCGTGGSALFLAEKAEAEWIVGVDLLRDMIKVAKKNAINSGLDRKICFLVCDGRYLPFKASCFDALVSRGDVFCFLVPLKKAVQELRRVMRHKGVVVLEMDNRLDWKPGTVISSGFRRMHDGKIAYVVETFTTKRNHWAVSYILDPCGKIVEEVVGDLEFREKGCKVSECSLRRVEGETIEIRQSVATHWPTCRGLYALFEKNGFTEVRVMGNGLLMRLLLDGDEKIVEAMKSDPELFFEIEKRLVPYVNPCEAPTMILRATAP